MFLKVFGLWGSNHCKFQWFEPQRPKTFKNMQLFQLSRISMFFFFLLSGPGVLQLAGWLAGGWPAGWLAGCLGGSLACWPAKWPYIDICTHDRAREKGRERESGIGMQALIYKYILHLDISICVDMRCISPYMNILYMHKYNI